MLGFLGRPALCYCGVLIQSLFATCLTYWEVDRKPLTRASPEQLNSTRKVLLLIKEVSTIQLSYSKHMTKYPDIIFLSSSSFFILELSFIS